MRRITKWLLLPLIAVSLNAKAQDYNITFAILGSSDKPTTVKVENTTQSTEETLTGNDVLNLVADISSGINDLNSNSNSLQVYPNPIQENATLAFTNPSADKVTVSIVNTAGVELTNLSADLPQGEVNYTLSGLSRGNYVVNVQSASFRSSCVIISQLENAGAPTITLNGTNTKAIAQSQPTLKSAKAAGTTVKMQYTAGDVLKFTAALNTKEAIVDSYTATQNGEIEFSFDYTVTFNDYDNSEVSTFTGKYNDAVTYPTHPDNKTGYTANGWDVADAKVPANDDLVITAQYEMATYTITYNNVGTKNSASNPATYNLETADITLVAPADSTGYIFGGWYTDAAFNDTITTPAIIQGSIGDTAFYAKWEWIPVPITDYEGNSYNTIKIGNQYWLTENLRSTRYANGTAIPNVDDRTQNGSGANNTAWGNLGDNDTDKAYCWYDNDSITYSQTYGALYTYAAATSGDNSGDKVQGVCPTGWHLPSDEEWKTLEMELGMSQDNADDTGPRGTNEGAKLAGNANLWTDGTLDSHAEFGTSGFTALPGGYRNGGNGTFSSAGDSGVWWSSTRGSSSYAYYRYLRYNNAPVYRNNLNKSSGFSIRCIRD